jgi:hypothetical protein
MDLLFAVNGLSRRRLGSDTVFSLFARKAGMLSHHGG